jgi:lysozyme
MLIGIDVSAAQGPIDWGKATAPGACKNSNVPPDSGVKFAIIKATEGEQIRDGRFHSHLEGANKFCTTGVYMFCRPDSDATDDVAALFEYVDAHYFDLPIVIDLEGRNGNSAVQVLKWLRQATELIAERDGRTPLLYTYPGFFLGIWNELGADARVEAASWLLKMQLFIAHYGVGTPLIPKPWAKSLIWQRWANTHVRTETGKVIAAPYKKVGDMVTISEGVQERAVAIAAQPGKVDGVAGEVDVDVFDGSIDDLRKLARLRTVIAEPAAELAATK